MNTENMGINIIVTGVGGQGNVLAAKLLAIAGLEAGWEVTVGDVFGLTQRGGSVASHVRLFKGDPLPPLIPSSSLDILVAFEPLEALRILTRFGGETTRAIINNQPIWPIGVQAGRFQYPEAYDLCSAIESLTSKAAFIDATEMAKELGSFQVLNMVMLGALYGSGWIPLSPTAFESIINSSTPFRFRGLNIQAFRQGLKGSIPNGLLPK